jgi:hypothetical protein
VAAAVSLLLFALATGLDLATLARSPGGVAAAPVSLITLIAMVVTQWVSAGLGGYIAGRLRTRGSGTHTREVFFRDTSHGFLAWCVATVFMASGLTSATSSAVGTSARSARPDAVAAPPASANWPRLPDGRVAADARVSHEGRSAGGLQWVQQRPIHNELVLPAGPTPDDANTAELPDMNGIYPGRSTGVLGACPAGAPGAVLPDLPGGPVERQIAGEATDIERRNAATASIFTALSLLVGTLIASVSAALGGRRRDLIPDAISSPRIDPTP